MFDVILLQIIILLMFMGCNSQEVVSYQKKNELANKHDYSIVQNKILIYILYNILFSFLYSGASIAII